MLNKSKTLTGTTLRSVESNSISLGLVEYKISLLPKNWLSAKETIQDVNYKSEITTRANTKI